MIDRMKFVGYGNVFDKKVYYGFLKIFCGIERIDYVLSVFVIMKRDGCEFGVKIYDLLIGKLYVYGRVEKVKVFFNEVVRNGVLIELKVYKLDLKFVKKLIVVKKGKKWLILFEKMVLKRK